MHVPIRIGPEHPGGPAIVEMPLDELDRHLDAFDPERSLFYFRGREPLAHRLEDTDGDGVADVAVVKLPRDGDEHWVLVVSPAPDASSSPTTFPAGGSALGVQVLFHEARH